MLHKTRGIVLKTSNYSEHSVIVQVFTEKFGLQSYMLNGVRKAKAKISKSSLQPLHLLDMVVYQKPTSNLQRAKEVRNQPAFLDIPLNIQKSTISLFLCELLHKCLRNQTGNDQPLFDYIYHSMLVLDHSETGLANFHIRFLINLTRYLGFYPQTPERPMPYFDLLEGSFCVLKPPHPHFVASPLCDLWFACCKAGTENNGKINISKAVRYDFLENILVYYHLHIESMGTIKSLSILRDVFE